MNKYFVAFLFNTLSIATFSQGDTNSTKSKIAIGFTFSPDYSYRYFHDDGFMDKIEIPKLGYTTGLTMILNLFKKISLETGFYYANKGQRSKKTDIRVIDPEPIPVDKMYYINSYRFLDVPVKVNYYVGNKRLKVVFGFGVSANFYLSQKSDQYLIYKNGDRSYAPIYSNYKIFRPVNLSILAGIGINYDMSKRIIFKTEPIYRLGITSATHQNYIAYFPYSLGINTGFLFRI